MKLRLAKHRKIPNFKNVVFVVGDAPFVGYIVTD